MKLSMKCTMAAAAVTLWTAAACGHGAPPVVQQASSAGNSSSVTVAMPAFIRIGDVVGIRILSWGAKPTQLSDNNNYIYIPYRSANGFGPNQKFVSTAYCHVVTLENTKLLTVTLPSPTWAQIKVAEFAPSPSFACPTK